MCACVLTVTHQLYRQSTVRPSAYEYNTLLSCCVRHNMEGVTNFCYANDCTFLQGWVDRISIYFRLGSVCLTARGCSSLPGELCRARVATRVEGSKGVRGCNPLANVSGSTAIRLRKVYKYAERCIAAPTVQSAYCRIVPC